MSHKGMGTHQSAAMKNDEWLTPPHVLNALGEFDLDPCAVHPSARPWATAYTHFWENGLDRDWFGRVWCNPPYGLEAAAWLDKLADHNQGTALIFARTETKMFFDQVWSKATALLFLKGRLYFHYVDGSKAKANAGAPSVLIAYVERDALILENQTEIRGQFIRLLTPTTGGRDE